VKFQDGMVVPAKMTGALDSLLKDEDVVKLKQAYVTEPCRAALKDYVWQVYKQCPMDDTYSLNLAVLAGCIHLRAPLAKVLRAAVSLGLCKEGSEPDFARLQEHYRWYGLNSTAVPWVYDTKGASLRKAAAAGREVGGSTDAGEDEDEEEEEEAPLPDPSTASVDELRSVLRGKFDALKQGVGLYVGLQSLFGADDAEVVALRVRPSGKPLRVVGQDSPAFAPTYAAVALVYDRFRACEVVKSGNASKVAAAQAAADKAQAALAEAMAVQSATYDAANAKLAEAVEALYDATLAPAAPAPAADQPAPAPAATASDGEDDLPLAARMEHAVPAPAPAAAAAAAVEEEERLPAAPAPAAPGSDSDDDGDFRMEQAVDTAPAPAPAPAAAAAAAAAVEEEPRPASPAPPPPAPFGVPPAFLAALPSPPHLLPLEDPLEDDAAMARGFGLVVESPALPLPPARGPQLTAAPAAAKPRGAKRALQTALQTAPAPAPKADKRQRK